MDMLRASLQARGSSDAAVRNGSGRNGGAERTGGSQASEARRQGTGQTNRGKVGRCA